MKFERFIITMLIPLIPPLGINGYQLISKAQVLAQPLNTKQAKAEQLLELTSIDRPQIEILRGVSFGSERIRGIFQGAGWTFYPNGKFTFTPQNSLISPPISGTYAKVGNNFEFQGEYTSEVIATVSIDGTIRINEENLVLDAIYTDSASPQRIVRISQILAKGKSNQKIEPVPRSENSVRTDQAEINNNLTRELEALGIDGSVLEKKIEGITIPSIFKISLEGKTEKGAFGPLSGYVFISEPPSKSRNPFSVTLAVNPDLYGTNTNGWIVLNSEEAGKEVPNIQIQAKNGKVRLELSPSKVMPSSTYSLGANESSPDLNRLVLIDNAILTFSVEGNQISGDIKASGIIYPAGADEYLSDAKQSTYEAKLTGEIPTSPPVEKLKTALASSFNGQWYTDNSRFGHIELQQNGQQVRGTYTGGEGGTIEGIAQGNRLDFTWQDRHQGEKGRGFFRAVASGGKLVGIWKKEDGNSTTKDQSLIAFWQPPSWINIGTFSPFDLQELRYLGQDLALQNRCEPAALILDKIIVSYLSQQQQKTQSFEKASIEQEREQENNLISAGFSLIYLIGCHFQLGDYEQLLKSLDYGLEIQRLLGPEESASRLFRRLTVDIAKDLADTADNFETMENGYKRLQQMVSGNLGVVGIFIEENQKTREFIISEVENNKPAELAGILAQDVILKIDGKTTQGMDESQVIEKLRGKPGTPITITVQRGNQMLEFQLTRAKIEIGSTQRQTELVESLTIFSDSLNHLREQSKNNLNKINTSAEKIAQGKEEPVPALLYVTQDVENQIVKFNEDTNILISKQKEIFSNQKEALQELEFIFSALKESLNNVDKVAQIPIKDLDAREEKMMQLIEKDKNLSSIEKQLFKNYYTDVVYRLSFFSTLKIQKNLIEKFDIKKLFEENKKRSLEMTSGLSDKIEAWRARLVEDFDKIQALDQGQSFFQKAIEFLISLGDKEEALVTSEKSRARAFADLLANRLSSSLESRSIANPPSLEGIQRIAKEQNATLVEYSVIKDKNNTKLYIWVIQSTGKVEFRKVEITKSLNKSLETLVTYARNYMGVRGRGSIEVVPLDDSEAENQLKQLHKLLIEPIADLLPSDPNAHVIFMPQGELFLVPFPALQDENGKYLIEKHTILTAPAIQVLDLTQKQRVKVQQANPKGLVVVGNPTMPKVTVKIGEPPEQLNSLPAAENEAITIAKLLNTKALTGNQATKKAILSQLPQARIIHLATHGLLDDFKGLGVPGAIALAPSGNDDGLLTASEILDLKLNAELVVLSACDTGRGRITGDGVIGLSRSLITAGVPSIIVSLWSVPDAPTASLMTEFYRNWQEKKLDKAQALRQAMLTTMKNHPNNPKDWAAFTLIGEAE
jgi:CHAT domain-containing protein